MIVNYWPEWFRALYGGGFPSDYCSFDLETTGFSRKHDVITQISHCLVEDGKPVNRLSLILNWTGHRIVNNNWLRNRMHNLQQSMLVSGCHCHITYDRMQEEGIEPERALEFYRDFLAELQRKEYMFVCHGGYTFDESMLSANFQGFSISDGFAFGDNSLIDTDGIAKASQIVDNPKVHPVKGDTLRSYFHRVRYARAPGVKSNLDRYCFDKYDFGQHGLKRVDMHDAFVDSYATHLLMEGYREELLPSPISYAPVASTVTAVAPPSRQVYRSNKPLPVVEAAMPIRYRKQRNR